jgi:hypothetical protein
VTIAFQYLRNISILLTAVRNETLEALDVMMLRVTKQGVVMCMSYIV